MSENPKHRQKRKGTKRVGYVRIKGVTPANTTSTKIGPFVSFRPVITHNLTTTVVPATNKPSPYVPYIEILPQRYVAPVGSPAAPVTADGTTGAASGKCTPLFSDLPTFPDIATVQRRIGTMGGLRAANSDIPGGLNSGWMKVQVGSELMVTPLYNEVGLPGLV